MREIFKAHADDLTRGSLMLATGLGGWLVQNAAALDILSKLAIAAVTVVSILIQLALAILKHRKGKD